MLEPDDPAASIYFVRREGGYVLVRDGDHIHKVVGSHHSQTWADYVLMRDGAAVVSLREQAAREQALL